MKRGFPLILALFLTLGLAIPALSQERSAFLDPLPSQRGLSIEAAANPAVLPPVHGFGYIHKSLSVARFTTPNPAQYDSVMVGEASAAGALVGGKYYFIGFFTDSLYVVDTLTHVRKTLGFMLPPNGTSWLSMAVDPRTHVVYGLSGDQIGSISFLNTIDLAAAKASAVQYFNTDSALASIAIDTSGSMYATRIPTGTIFLVDKYSASITPVGSLGIQTSQAQSLAFDPRNNNLYFFGRNADSSRYEARLVDPTLKSSTFIQALPSLYTGVTFVNPAATGEKIAFVYSGTTDSTTALQFKSFLDLRGYATTLIPAASIVGTDFSAYQLIILGQNTGSMNSWQTTQAVSTISGSGKPVIGIGEGGYAYFGKLALHIGYPLGASGSGTDLRTNMSGHPVFTYPSPVFVTGDTVVTLFSTAVGNHPIYLPGTDSLVTVIGRTGEAPDYASIAVQGSNAYYAHNATPGDMTAAGRDVFSNLVRFMIHANVQIRIAYLYHSPAYAINIVSFLRDRGASVTMVDTSAIKGTNFSAYNLIVVDYYSKSTSRWGDSATIAAIQASKLPLVGMGDGGFVLFGQLGSSITWGNGAGGAEIEFNPVVTNHPIFTGPYAIERTLGGTVALGASSFISSVQYIPGLSKNATVIATSASDPGYATITTEGKFASWGPDTEPQLFSSNGQNLFYNLIVYQSQYKGSATGIETTGKDLPGTFSLNQNYPNPFNPSTRISYSLGQSARVTLKVYDILGREVATLVDAQQEAGAHTATFGPESIGRSMASGVYFYSLEAGSFRAVKKMLLMK
jgi:hypothetical protein